MWPLFLGFFFVTNFTYSSVVKSKSAIDCAKVAGVHFLTAVIERNGEKQEWILFNSDPMESLTGRYSRPNGKMTIFNPATKEAFQFPQASDTFQTSNGGLVIASLRFAGENTPYVLVHPRNDEDSIILKKAADVSGVYHKFLGLPPGPKVDAFIAKKDAALAQLGLNPSLPIAKKISADELYEEFESQIGAKIFDMKLSFDALRERDKKSGFYHYKDFDSQIKKLELVLDDIRKNGFKYKGSYIKSESSRVKAEIVRLKKAKSDFMSAKDEKGVPEYNFDSDAYNTVFLRGRDKNESISMFTQRLVDKCSDYVKGSTNYSSNNFFIEDLRKSLQLTQTSKSPDKVKVDIDATK
tara:strand:+ start:13811 stop:14869 length:1059 start_codon:yes stop_codon:yes gene_type:complete